MTSLLNDVLSMPNISVMKSNLVARTIGSLRDLFFNFNGEREFQRNSSEGSAPTHSGIDLLSINLGSLLL